MSGSHSAQYLTVLGNGYCILKLKFWCGCASRWAWFTYATMLTSSLMIIWGCCHFDEKKYDIPCVIHLMHEGKTTQTCRRLVTPFSITQCLKNLIPPWRTPPDPVFPLSQVPPETFHWQECWELTIQWLAFLLLIKLALAHAWLLLTPLVLFQIHFYRLKTTYKKTDLLFWAASFEISLRYFPPVLWTLCTHSFCFLFPPFTGGLFGCLLWFLSCNLWKTLTFWLHCVLLRSH